MDAAPASFQAIDFAIFIVLFLLSAFVGVIFAYRDRNKQSTDNYYFGGRKISPFPVAISIAVSFISAITVLAIPVEVYLFGSVFFWSILSIVIGNVVAILYYVPLFHRLQINCVYEYLELRFHRRVRILASTLGVISTTMALAVAVYMPSLALSAVTPLDLSWTIALVSITCTFYTTIGGMKAVIWTDVLQSIIMVVGMVAVFARTLVIVGGLDKMTEALNRGRRNNFLTFNADPRIRSTAWSILIGQVITMTYQFVCSQALVQRWLSCKSVKSARYAVAMSIIPMILYIGLAIGCGLTAYAYYEGCDPIEMGQITKPDQLIPRLAVEIFSETPGFSGLLVSAALCGTLSTVSSGINSLAAIGLIDFIQGFFPSLSSRRKIFLSKILTLCFGSIVMAISYVVTLSSSNAIQIIVTVLGIVAAPLLGLYTMGVFAPWINHKSALSGAICGMIFAAWISFGALFSPIVPVDWEPLPVSIDRCSAEKLIVKNGTTIAGKSYTTEQLYSLLHLDSTAVPVTLSVHGIFATLHSISPFLYGLFGLIASLIAAHIASIFFGFARPSEANPDLFMPILDNNRLPKQIREFFRFGVPEKIVDEKMMT